jgi:hypothetical protein
MALQLQLVQHFIIDSMQHSKALCFFLMIQHMNCFPLLISFKQSRKCRRDAPMMRINIHHHVSVRYNDGWGGNLP